MEIDHVNLVRLDMLPAQAGLEVEVDPDRNTVRFQPFYLHEPRVEGPWTDEFSIDLCPIMLKWVDLWPGGDPTRN